MDHEIKRSRSSGQHGGTPSLLKIQKISWAQWHVPVIPATQEAEAGELPEPRGRRLWLAEIVPLHNAWVTRVKLHLKKKKRVNLTPPSPHCEVFNRRPSFLSLPLNRKDM